MNNINFDSNNNTFVTYSKDGELPSVRRLKALLRLTIRNLKKTQAPLKDDGYFVSDEHQGYMFTPSKR